MGEVRHEELELRREGVGTTTPTGGAEDDARIWNTQEEGSRGSPMSEMTNALRPRAGAETGGKNLDVRAATVSVSRNCTAKGVTIF